MRRALAITYAKRIADRLHRVNGCLSTPLTNYDAVRFKRVWVFGSTIKGSENPNDLDLLIEFESCGRYFRHIHTRTDKEMLRRYGYRCAPDARIAAAKWLTRGMKKVSRHWSDIECVEIDKKVLIYPRFDMVGDEYLC